MRLKLGRPDLARYAGDDLDATMRIFTRLADDQGVALHLPRVWQPEDPWVGLP